MLCVEPPKPPITVLGKASETTEQEPDNMAISFLPKNQSFSTETELPYISLPRVNQQQGNCNFVWHCLIGWIFPLAKGGLTDSFTPGLDFQWVCVFFLSPSKQPQEMPGCSALTCNEAALP